jgi:hypothetical protein
LHAKIALTNTAARLFASNEPRDCAGVPRQQVPISKGGRLAFSEFAKMAKRSAPAQPTWLPRRGRPAAVLRAWGEAVPHGGCCACACDRRCERELYGAPAMFEAALLWLLCCNALHRATGPLLARRKQLSAGDRSQMQNMVVAAAHSVVMSAGAAAYLWPRAVLSLDAVRIERVQPNSGTENFYCEIMLGYLLYDVVISVRQGEGVAMLLHHLLGMASHSSMRCARSQKRAACCVLRVPNARCAQCARALALMRSPACSRDRWHNIGGPYMMWIHFAEGSTPFLHLGGLLGKLRRSDAAVTRVNALFCALFFLCRVVSAPLCLRSYWRSRPLWAPQEALHSFVLAITVCFVAINYFWWALIVRKAYRLLKGAEKRA